MNQGLYFRCFSIKPHKLQSIWSPQKVIFGYTWFLMIIVQKLEKLEDTELHPAPADGFGLQSKLVLPKVQKKSILCGALLLMHYKKKLSSNPVNVHP